jgi:hypothetical protein
MPTDLVAVLARNNAVRVARQNDISALLICFIVCLGVLVLLFASPTFAEAMALLGSI